MEMMDATKFLSLFWHDAEWNFAHRADISSLWCFVGTNGRHAHDTFWINSLLWFILLMLHDLWSNLRSSCIALRCGLLQNCRNQFLFCRCSSIYQLALHCFCWIHQEDAVQTVHSSAFSRIFVEIMMVWCHELHCMVGSWLGGHKGSPITSYCCASGMIGWQRIPSL